MGVEGRQIMWLWHTAVCPGAVLSRLLWWALWWSVGPLAFAFPVRAAALGLV